MTDSEFLRSIAEKGFHFDGAKGLITEESRARLAADAAMITTANSGVPDLFTTYIDPAVIDILTAPRNARQIFGETQKGDWTETTAMFKAIEHVGKTTAYTDFGNGAAADVNVVYPLRQNYIAQTHIRYGIREVAVSGKALVDLASEKQKAAAEVIDIDTNKFYLYGVANKEIYGLLNDPNLPAAITPASVDTKTKWEDKDTKAIYNDVMSLASELFTNSQGNIDQSSDLVLCVSPRTNVQLAKATDFNVSVMDMLKRFFTNLSVVTLPELYSADSGDTVMLISRSVKGQPTAEFGYSEKMRALPLIQETSYFEQKYVFGTYGAIIYQPYAIARMTGI